MTKSNMSLTEHNPDQQLKKVEPIEGLTRVPSPLEPLSKSGTVSVQSSLQIGQDPTKWTEKFQNHSTSAESIFGGPDPFSLKTVTITGDPHQEQTVAAPVQGPRQHLDFLGLPAEVRNMIYEYLLICQGSELINDSSNSDGRDTDSDTSLEQNDAVYVELPRSDESTRTTAPSLSVLSACHQINEEGTSLCYSANYFSFGNMSALLDFLKRIGDNRRSLRHVRLICSRNDVRSFASNTANVANTAQLLADARVLISLVLLVEGQFRHSKPFPNVQLLAGCLMPAIKTVYSRFRYTDEMEEALDKSIPHYPKPCQQPRAEIGGEHCIRCLLSRLNRTSFVTEFQPILRNMRLEELEAKATALCRVLVHDKWAEHTAL